MNQIKSNDLTHRSNMPTLTAEQMRKVENYRKLNESALSGQIVCAGSSLMENFPVERFLAEEKSRTVVYNRGIGAFRMADLMAYLDVCILDLKPSKLFINIGTNDLNSSVVTDEKLMGDYAQILNKVREALPDTEIYLMAYYPINYGVASDAMKPILAIRTNERLQQANAAVQELAKAYGVNYIDINAPLKDEAGRLKAEYTTEGMHINEAGYRNIFPLLKEYF